MIHVNDKVWSLAWHIIMISDFTLLAIYYKCIFILSFYFSLFYFYLSPFPSIQFPFVLSFVSNISLFLLCLPSGLSYVLHVHLYLAKFSFRSSTINCHPSRSKYTSADWIHFAYRMLGRGSWVSTVILEIFFGQHLPNFLDLRLQ